MFSVGAKPFNSRARATYGGAIYRKKYSAKPVKLGGYTPAQTNDLYLHKMYHEMVGKFSEDPNEKMISRAWLKELRKLEREDPLMKRYIRMAARRYTDGIIRPPLDQGQGQLLVDAFKGLPVPTAADPALRWAYRAMLKAPYPSWPIMNGHPELGNPYQAHDRNAPSATFRDMAPYLRTWGQVWAGRGRGRRPTAATRLALRTQIERMWDGQVPNVPAAVAPPIAVAGPAPVPAFAPIVVPNSPEGSEIDSSLYGSFSSDGSSGMADSG